MRTRSTLATIALVVVLGVAAVVLVLVSRPGADDADQPVAEPSSEVGDEPSAAPEPEELVVPTGVQVTDPGTELGLGESATLAWEPRQEQVGVLDVTVERIEQTTFEDSFEGWQLDEATRSATPYFVRLSATNVGDTPLGQRQVPLYALDSTGRLVEASSFAERFAPCPGGGVLPTLFGPGQAETTCLVFLVPAGAELEGVTFRPTEQFSPITWSGEVEQPRGREGRAGRGAAGDGTTTG